MTPGWGQWLILGLFFSLFGGVVGGAMWAWTGSSRTRGGFFLLSGLTMLSFVLSGVIYGNVDWGVFWSTH
jgi:hypothetical protein